MGSKFESALQGCNAFVVKRRRELSNGTIERPILSLWELRF